MVSQNKDRMKSKNYKRIRNILCSAGSRGMNYGSIFIVITFHAVFNWLSVSEAGGQFATAIMNAPLILWALFITRRYGTENAAPVQKQVA